MIEPTRGLMIKKWGPMLKSVFEPTIIPNDEFIFLLGSHFQKNISINESLDVETIESFQKYTNQDQVLLYYHIFHPLKLRKQKIEKIKNRINDTNR